MNKVKLLTIACLLASLIATHARADEASDALAKQEDQSELAVDKALGFLAKQQLADGSFQAAQYKTAVTSLSIMAFLSKGYTPGDGPYGDVINKGIDYVLSTIAKDGKLVPEQYVSTYVHAINTLMLSEVSGMVNKPLQEKIDKVLPQCLKALLTAQQVRRGNPKQQGGWRYGPTSTDSDLSCTGWALMSLRSARNNGAAVPKDAIDQAVTFIMNTKGPNGEFFYQPGGGGGVTTQVGLLCLELCGKHKDPACLAAGDHVLKTLPKTYGEGFFYYGLYYASQGMFQLGGTYWDNYAKFQYDLMLPKQNPDGSWPLSSAAEQGAGICYSTSMSVLTLSVSFRQLPIYQR